MYNVPEVGWFNVLYNVISLVTLTSYPFILSVTPFTERPADVTGLLRNTRMVDAFLQYLDRTSTSANLRVYQLVLQDKIYQSTDQIALQRKGRMQMAKMQKELLVFGTTQGKECLDNYDVERLEKYLTLELEVQFMKFQSDPGYSVMLTEVQRGQKGSNLMELIKNKSRRTKEKGVVGTQFIGARLF